MNPEIKGFNKELAMKTLRVMGVFCLCWMAFSVGAVAQEAPNFAVSISGIRASNATSHHNTTQPLRRVPILCEESQTGYAIS